MSDFPPPHAPVRRRCLAAAVLVALLAAAPDHSRAAAYDAPWPRLPGEPSWPLFGSMLGPGRQPVAPAQAATTHTVANCNDDGPGSLRATIVAAADTDTIDLTQLQCGQITLETGAIPIRVDNLTLVGNGPGRPVIDGGDRDRVLVHYGLGTLTLQQLTVSGGYYHAPGRNRALGGCIAARSYLNLDRVVVRNCRAVGVGSYGGGTFSYTLQMKDSTITGNSASGRLDDATTAGFGGGAYTFNAQIASSTISGNLTDYQTDPRFQSYGIGGGLMSIYGGSIQDSTIDSNVSQGRGGGVAAFGNLLISNSTISGNHAQTEIGGGAFLRWPSILQLDNSTIAFNRASGDAGGIWLGAPGSYLQSSIAFANTVDTRDPDTGGDIGNRPNQSATGAEITIGGSNNLVGTHGPLLTLPPDTLDLDPALGSLAWNGGPTRTHALRPGSPAIDAGSNPNGLEFDQLGNPRIQGAGPDIGAFERQTPRAPTAPVSVPTLSTWAIAILGALLGWTAVRRGRFRPRIPLQPR